MNRNIPVRVSRTGIVSSPASIRTSCSSVARIPDWPPRYQQVDDSGNAGFRAFVERTIREETPTHLAPTIHWLDRTAMAEFETAYRAWLDRQRDYWSDKLGG